MRAIPLVCVLTLSSSAYAGGFAELGGGVMIPVADHNWTDYVDSSPKLFVRAGAAEGSFGGMLSLDWTPINTDYTGFQGPLASSDVNANRYRILVHLIANMKAGAKLMARARFGAGIDIQHINIKTTAGPFFTEASSTDNGLALEPAVGLWYSVSDTVQLGGELALPISFHSYDSSNNIQLNDFTSLDIDLLFGVRIMGSR